MQFEFASATKILFGPGRLNSIGALVDEFGKKVLIISGCTREVSDRLFNLLDLQKVTYSFVKINREPTIDMVRELVTLAHRSSSDVVIGIGGGSALDAAKATAALLSNPGDITDYLEVIGLNKPLLAPSRPLIAIPTTSGTGSEVTRNAVLSSPAHQVKVSLRSHYLFPKISLIDPVLTLSVPPLITAFTGLDTLTQLIEPYTCNSPNPLTDAICLEGIHRVSRSLLQAYDTGDDLQAREDMSLSSLFSGLALANARLGAVHGLAGPIGGEIPAPHGTICAALLPNVMEINLAAMIKRAPGHDALERYETIGKILTKDPNATAAKGIQWVRDFCSHANIRQLSAFGLTNNQFDKILANAVNASSMKGNPIQLTREELRNILENSL